jgi:predicted nucleic acid-binding protein
MGLKYLLDTNAIIALINGNEQLALATETAGFVGVSVISIIEFLSFPSLSEKDKILFEEFTYETEVFDLSARDILMINEVTRIRKNYRLKLPDEVLAATAIINDCILITTDTGFKKILTLPTLSY